MLITYIDFEHLHAACPKKCLLTYLAKSFLQTQNITQPLKLPELSKNIKAADLYDNTML